MRHALLAASRMRRNAQPVPSGSIRTCPAGRSATPKRLVRPVRTTATPRVTGPIVVFLAALASIRRCKTPSGAQLALVASIATSPASVLRNVSRGLLLRRRSQPAGVAAGGAVNAAHRLSIGARLHRIHGIPLRKGPGVSGHHWTVPHVRGRAICASRKQHLPGVPERDRGGVR